MNAVAVITHLHKHRLWASALLMESCASLTEFQVRRPLAIGRGSIWSALVHTYSAEKIWLCALVGEPSQPMARDGDFASLEELRGAWSRLNDQWRKHLGTLNNESLDQPVVRTNSAGVTTTTSAAEALLHVSTHSMYHAAQIVNMMRQVGVERLADTSLMTMVREQQKKQF